MKEGNAWERYGLQTDDEYFAERQQAEKVFFTIEELSWTREGNESKESRVERLEPDLRTGRFFLPLNVWYRGKPSVWGVVCVCPSCTHGNPSDAKACEKCNGELGDTFKVEYRDIDNLTKAQREALDGGAGDLVSKAIKRKDEEGKVYDVTERLIQELEKFPFSLTDDLVDACSRIYDLEPIPPTIVRQEDTTPPVFIDS